MNAGDDLNQYLTARRSEIDAALARVPSISSRMPRHGRRRDALQRHGRRQASASDPVPGQRGSRRAAIGEWPCRRPVRSSSSTPTR